MIIRSTALVLSLLLAAPGQAQDIISIGDSIMYWNGAQSIPAQLSRELSLPVDDRSLAGSQVRTGFWNRMQGLDIRAQLGDDRPDILVMTGGGNDLGDGCGCREGCAEEVDRLLTEDGGGAFGTFLRDVVADGTRVFVLGYPDPPVGGNDFSGCVADLRALANRLDALEGVTLVPAHQAIDPADMSYYDADRVHPSVKASSVMAKLLARAIEASR
ncbi:MAG: SGNH/GDSL hydrolase family protein [Pseudomonadota bacterium]